MNEFNRTKITIAIALIGICIAANPLIKVIKGIVGYGVITEIYIFYYATIFSLAVCVYSYALDFLTENPLNFLHKLGNYFYSLALILPFVSIFSIITKILFPHLISVNKEAGYVVIADVSYSPLFIWLSIIVSLVLSWLLNRKIYKLEQIKSEKILIKLIIKYLVSKNTRKVSFDMIRKIYGQNLSDEFFKDFINKNSDIFELTIFSKGSFGVQYVNNSKIEM